MLLFSPVVRIWFATFWITVLEPTCGLVGQDTDRRRQGRRCQARPRKFWHCEYSGSSRRWRRACSRRLNSAGGGRGGTAPRPASPEILAMLQSAAQKQ
jgi:hypothetical protein